MKPTIFARLFSAALAAALLCALAAPRPVQAGAVITADPAADELNANDWRCSLREAVKSANGEPAAPGCVQGAPNSHDEVRLMSGVYLLTGKGDNNSVHGDLDITDSITISGKGMGESIIRSSGDDRVIHVIDLRTGTAELFNLTISGGRSVSSADKKDGGLDGGGILVMASNLNLTRVDVTDNRANGTGIGGGIRITMYSPILDRNIGARLTVVDSVIQGNAATSGGGISSEGALTIRQSLIRNNQATSTTGGGGGGVHNYISLFGYSALIVNSTLTGNSAPSGSGAAVYSTGSLTMTNVTVHNNSAKDDEGLYLAANSTVTLKNSIFSGVKSNAAHKYIEAASAQQVINTNDRNLSQDATFQFTGEPADYINRDPGYGSPANYGGYTELFPLNPGSPAINRALNSDCPVSDQRGFFMRVDGFCDIGAFEADAVERHPFYLPSISRKP